MKTIAILLLGATLFVNETRISIDKEHSNIEIIGTSSLHEWEASVEKYSIGGTISESTVSDLRLEVLVNSIESGKSIMNDKIQDALLVKNNPNIIFEANELTISDGRVYGPGKLTIAGASKPFQFSGLTISQPSGKVMIKGESKLKMTDFGIDPPTAMFGTLTTGDEVTIQYEILLSN